MQLTVLGCRSGMPGAGQCSSSYLVETGAARLLLDCGPGAATALSTIMHPDRLDAVVISHLHLDHCYDLLPVGKTLLAGHGRFANLFPSLPELAARVQRAPVPLYVPEGGRERLRALAALFPVATIPLLDRAFEVAFDVREYTPGDTFDVGDATVSLHELRHAVPNCGTRIDGASGSLAYTGDTGVTADLVPFAQDVDLLLAESTLELTDTTDHGHLSATDAGTVASAAGVGQLVLTHFVTAEPAWLQARKADAERAFDGPVHLATPAGRFAARDTGPLPRVAPELTPRA
ncbi:MBL fold metallo-hydrolase [Parafrankia colletiae]|uniref:MBL fold metallo-hydrolase n=1 Tax=Parafrankia colletiae TaxID=573497 RepID=A0A1S1QGM6_9ACTN|nr:MBL fold metallo-hydrolase [Parafrankia colletiae]MCK9904030.1 MBL fold metallo-hydrolase [Frankia sp. Cpl3]OHV33110.1 MBL fold metallo-hydrolase [Parafrankia colletiae]